MDNKFYSQQRESICFNFYCRWCENYWWTPNETCV